LYERTFLTAKGPVDFLAEVAVEGDTLTLKDVAIYNRESGAYTGVLRDVLAARRQIIDDAKGWGFKTLEIRGIRVPNTSTSANPGKIVDLPPIDLTKP
jgi:hypothetical protein